MVSIADYELAPDVVWVGSLPGLMCRGAEQVNERLEQIRASGRTFSRILKRAICGPIQKTPAN